MSSLRPLSFVVVGSARSGTTLVQRLLCELPGVTMPPETHFLSMFARGVLERQRGRLSPVEIRAELDQWSALDQVRGVQLDIPAVLSRVGDPCESLAELFSAVVDVLAGEGTVVGEKTPAHLLWWRPLSRALPELRIVAVVRDPRAVVASNLRAPWVRHYVESGWPEDELHVALATTWTFEQAQVGALSKTLGERALVLRYEDVVTDTARVRARLSVFLGLGLGAGHSEPRARAAKSFILPWETWKHDVAGPMQPERIDAWRNQGLEPEQASVVASLCRSGMRRFGYAQDDARGLGDLVRLTRRNATTRQRRHALIAWLEQDLAGISQVVL